jgi:ubiquitin carboxyl-terminal hydrolase 4/11/15
MASEVYKNRFFKHYDDSATVSDQIQHNDDAYLYELDDIPTNWPSKNKKPKKSLYYGSSSSYRFEEEEEEPQPGAPETERLLVPVFNKVYKESKFNRSPNLDGFAFPFFIVVNREEAKNLDTIMSKIVEKYQLLTSRNLYEHVQERYDDIEDYEEANEGVEVNEQKGKVAGDPEQEEDDRDGFVNVSMKDAGSVQDSENADEAEGRSPRKTIRRGLPTGLQELFNVKVSKRKSGDASLLTGWQSLDASLDIRERLFPDNPPTPPPRKPSVFPAGGNSGRRSPESVSDVDNFEDAPEPEGDMMQDVSDDEENPQFGQNSFSRPPINVAFAPVIGSDFYGNSSANSSVKALKTPSRTPSPTILDESPLIRWGEGLICEWTESGWDAIFGGKSEDDLRGRAMWNDMAVYNDQELYNRRRRREDRKNKGIHLEDCLDEFAKNEVLSEEDPWYCPRCKVHRRATKKFELWKCPDILVIHLKRFSSSRNFRDKIDVLIDCPVEGLDLSNRVGLKEDDHGLIYDLIAVDNHYGGLGGGHYTAYAKNWIDDKWYYCDGSYNF